MIKIKIYFVFFFFVSIISSAQNTSLFGKIQATDDLENIHVVNTSKKFFTTTNPLGIFKIEAQKNDTLTITSVQYKTETVIVTQKNIDNKTISITLEEQVNELQEVLLGNTLSGNLNDDINNANTKRDINFYDLGIPGYKGKPKTQSERRLAEAGELNAKDVIIGALSGGIPLNPILNAISGRTKMLKKRVALETNTSLMTSLKSRLSEAFFNDNPLEEDKRMDFFYFCAEDPDFEKRCKTSDLLALDFMKEKYIKYKQNMSLKE